MNEKLVVIVDDEPVYVNVLQRLLHRSGYRTRVWTPGTDLLALVQHERPELIVLDMQLGATPGQSLLERLQQEPATSRIPVLLCSGAHWLLQDYAARLEPGRLATLGKPFDLAQFVATVKHLTDGTAPQPTTSMRVVTT